MTGERQRVTVTLVFDLPAGTLPADESFDHDTLDWLQQNFELAELRAETEVDSDLTTEELEAVRASERASEQWWDGRP